jgi:hypothetical protein
MVISKEFIEENYPLHKLVWEDKVAALEEKLESKEFPVSGIRTIRIL